MRALRKAVDFSVTLLLWGYFVGVFATLFWPFYLGAWLVQRERGVQWANRAFFGIFFRLLSMIAPGLTIEIEDRAHLESVRGSVVVCNHLSLLDPILLISLLHRTTSIVRTGFFRVPVFGWVLHGGGFFTPDVSAQSDAWMQRARRQLSAGTNLLVFPEGTRGSEGRLGGFYHGAFYIARRLGVPIEVLRVGGTGRLYEKGHVLFQTGFANVLTVRAIGRLEAAEVARAESLEEIAERVRGLYGLDGAEGPAEEC